MFYLDLQLLLTGLYIMKNDLHHIIADENCLICGTHISKQWITISSRQNSLNNCSSFTLTHKTVSSVACNANILQNDATNCRNLLL